MSAVEMCVPPNELSGAMAEMRVWLDERGFEPSVFSCREAEASVLVRVGFKISDEAQAFAARFSGRVSTLSAVGGK